MSMDLMQPIGRLRHKITIQQNTPTQSDTGEPQDSWSTYASRWAQFTPARGREFFDGMQLNAELSVKFIVRYDSTTKDIKPDMRVQHEGHTYRVVSAFDVRGVHRWIEIMCSELNP